MKFQFITSVAAMLLSSGHGVFAAEESWGRCETDNLSDCQYVDGCILVDLRGTNGKWWARHYCCEETDMSCITKGIPTPAPPAPGTMFPTPAPRRPSPSRFHKQCVGLGKEIVEQVSNEECGRGKNYGPEHANEGMEGCRNIVTKFCNKKLPGMIDQKCNRVLGESMIRSACEDNTKSWLGLWRPNLYDSKDYEAEPYDEEKFDYSYVSEDNKMDPYGEDFDSSTSEDVEMESYDEDFYAKKNGGNKKRHQGVKKHQVYKKHPGKKAYNIHIRGNAKHVAKRNGKCPSKCSPTQFGCMCPYEEDFDSSTSEDNLLESAAVAKD